MEQSSKKILILYNSIGLGHKSIAQNIGYYLSSAGYEVKLGDILETQKGKLSEYGTKIYQVIIGRMPFIWSFLYLNHWLMDSLSFLRIKVGGKNSHNVQALINGFNPDTIISTHTNSSAIVAFLKQQGMFNGRLGIAFSDYHLHRYWLYDQTDFYLANIEEQKQEMIALGIPENNIFVCGMTLPPKPEVNTEEVRNKLNIPADNKVVLIAGGSLGLGMDEELLKNLSTRSGVHIVVVCGKNKQLQEKLSAHYAGSSVIVLGYYLPMDELYAIADILISKPGGLSTAEALRWGLPMLVTYVMPGQEELNYEYLSDKGLIMPEPIVVESEIWEELETHSFRGSLKSNPNIEVLFPNPQVLLVPLQG